MRDSMDAKKVCIELWSMANYHWYRKYVIRNCSAASSVRWDPEVALKMHYMDSDGCYRCAEFCWDVLRSNHPAAENAGTVAVIDGGRQRSDRNITTCTHDTIPQDALLLTRFRYCNVPPPYAEHTLKFEKQVIAVAFLSEGDGNAIGVLLEDGQCLFYGASASSKIAIAPTERHSPIQLSHSGYRQIAWPRENVLVGLRTHSQEEYVDVFNIADRTHSTIALPAPARRLFSADGETFVETVRGDVHQGRRPSRFSDKNIFTHLTTALA